MLSRKTPLVAAVLLAGSQMAHSDELMINGFLNVNAGHQSTNDISISGYDDGVNFDVDTKLGLQIGKQVNESTSATVQLVARGADDYDTEAAWAYVTYSADENTDIRMGRLRTPFFYYSDFLEVGYAYNWIAPPTTVYRLNAFSSVSGIDLTRRFSAAGMDGAIQVYAGRYADQFAIGDDVYNFELRRAAGAVLTLSKGDFGARLSYHQADLTLDANPTAAGIVAAEPTLADVIDVRDLDLLAAAGAQEGEGDAFSADEDKSKFYQASLSYDNGSTAVVAEWTALDHETALLNDDMGYLITAAQRMGDATLHLTYTASEDELESGKIGQIQGNNESKETSIIVGVRYDYDASAALKFDITHHDEELVQGAKGESGLLYNVGLSLVF